MRVAIQIQERDRRKRERLKMRGMRQPKGTKPREFRVSGVPAWKPIWLGGKPRLGSRKGNWLARGLKRLWTWLRVIKISLFWGLTGRWAS